MPLNPEHREFLEYLRTMLTGLEMSTYSENLELIIETIDAALLEASEIREVSDGDANALPAANEADPPIRFARQARTSRKQPPGLQKLCN
jgi:hypothetical protein